MSTDAKLIKEKEILLVKRVWRFIMGRSRPSLYTRLMLMAAFVFFCYFFGWNLFRYLAMEFINEIDHPENILATMDQIGHKYDIDEPVAQFKSYFVAMTVTQLVVLVSMVMMYRRVMAGYFIFYGAQILTLCLSAIMLSWDYFWSAIHITEKLIPAVLIVLAAVGAWRLRVFLSAMEQERIRKQMG